MSRRESKALPPVSDRTIAVMLEEIVSQAVEAEYHFRQLRKHVEKGHVHEAYAETHALLNSAGVVSKILWGVDSQANRRRARLRRRLRITSAHRAGLEERSVRNFAEHVDERLEHAAVEQERARTKAEFKDRYLRVGKPPSNEEVSANFRLLDGSRFDFFVHGCKEVNLEALHSLLQNIRERCAFVLGLRPRSVADFRQSHDLGRREAAVTEVVRRIEGFGQFKKTMRYPRGAPEHLEAHATATRVLRQLAKEFYGIVLEQAPSRPA